MGNFYVVYVKVCVYFFCFLFVFLILSDDGVIVISNLSNVVGIWINGGNDVVEMMFECCYMMNFDWWKLCFFFVKIEL